MTIKHGSYSLTIGQQPISCKWVFKIKYQVDGTIECHKTQIVSKRFTQHKGIAYKDTFAPVSKLIIFVCLLVVVVVRHWSLH